MCGFVGVEQGANCIHGVTTRLHLRHLEGRESLSERIQSVPRLRNADMGELLNHFELNDNPLGTKN
jgi:hypothetical protein